MAKMFEMFAEQELTWDPDFTKVTSEERKKIEAAENSRYISDEDIDWDNLENTQNRLYRAG